jgi:hypothetical protein
LSIGQLSFGYRGWESLKSEGIDGGKSSNDRLNENRQCSLEKLMVSTLAMTDTFEGDDCKDIIT